MGFLTRYGLKVAGLWDERICNKRNSTFYGFQWYYRIPWAIGVVFEFFFFRVLGGDNYFKTNWWAIRTSAYLSFLLFLAMLTSRGTVEAYYSLSPLVEGESTAAILMSNSTVWYLHMINILYLIVGVLITFESIRMHGWLAPVRMLLYGLSCIFISIITIIVLALLIALTLFYLAYKIIKFFMSSRRRHRKYDDDESTPEILNNSYRRFRAELYDWEAERKNTLPERRKEKEPEVKRKRPKIKRKPRKKPKNDDIPRFHPD